MIPGIVGFGGQLGQMEVESEQGKKTGRNFTEISQELGMVYFPQASTQICMQQMESSSNNGRTNTCEHIGNFFEYSLRSQESSMERRSYSSSDESTR